MPLGRECDYSVVRHVVGSVRIRSASVGSFELVSRMTDGERGLAPVTMTQIGSNTAS